MEPRSGHIVYCSPEEMAAQQGSADLARHYGLPSFGGGGCSDSLLLDEQWAFETGMTLLTAAQSGVTLLHDIGYVASGTGSSYETMVVADELVGWVKAYLNGVTIDEESLAVAEIAAVGPGGTHLGRKYSRRHLREFFRPRLAGILEAARALKPDVRAIYHSDGHVEPILDDLVEIGFQGINPLQPEHMDAVAIRRRFGPRLAFWGTVGRQTTFAFGDPAGIRRETLERIESLGPAGLVLCPAYDIDEPDVPWANIAAFLEAGRSWGATGPAQPGAPRPAG
jgi:hypothetical protein